MKLFAALLCLLGSTAFADAGVIVAVRGSGHAEVRRKRPPVPFAAAVELEVKKGDTIVADRDSKVELALADGTPLRVGSDSEYKLEKKSVGATAGADTTGVVTGVVAGTPA